VLFYNKPIRLSSIRFFFDRSDRSIKEVGSSWGEFPFSFEAEPGEEVFAFFGATYVGDGIPYTGPIPAWLGIWMKHTG
jgi:hypothetical protein